MRTSKSWFIANILCSIMLLLLSLYGLVLTTWLATRFEKNVKMFGEDRDAAVALYQLPKNAKYLKELLDQFQKQNDALIGSDREIEKCFAYFSAFSVILFVIAIKVSSLNRTDKLDDKSHSD